MNNTFTQLKKRKDSLDKLKEEVAKNKVTFQKDERLWAPTKDKVGNGSAVIRFLPAPSGEEVPWVRIWEHGFKGPGGWYIENSLTTIGKDDPVSNTTPSCGTQKSRLTRILREIKNADSSMSQTFML